MNAKKISVFLLAVVTLFSVVFSSGIGVYASEISPSNYDVSTFSSSGYIAKNHRQTNYKITSGWYYVYTVTPNIAIVSRTYKVYRRNVTYLAKYDLYDRYSGRFIRTVSQRVNTSEEKWVLQK